VKGSPNLTLLISIIGRDNMVDVGNCEPAAIFETLDIGS
jgi:hypothetical protein